MLLMISKSAQLDKHPVDALKKLTDSLSDQYHPTVSPLLSRQAELFGVPVKSLQSTPRDGFRRTSYIDEDVVGAELYAKGSTLIAIRMVEMTRARAHRNENGKIVSRESTLCYLSVAYAGPTLDHRVMDEFEGHVKAVWGVGLREENHPSRKLSEIENLGQGGKAEAPTEQDVKCAEILSDKATRVLAIAIKSSSGLLLSDAPKQIPQKDRGRLDEVVQSLIAAGVVETEIVVICSKTGSQINRLSDVEVLQRLDEQNVRCSCGKSLSMEKAEEALSITEYGRTMLDGSRWLSVLVLQNLTDLGVPIENIRMEQEYAGEEVDCVAEIYGRLALFELKDKQFNLGNAYSFGAKMGIFRPDYPVIVTTEKVGSDARDHFVRSAQRGKRSQRFSASDSEAVNNIRFIEGIPALRRSLEEIVTSISIEAFAPFVQSALNFSTTSPGAILSAWAGKGH